MKKATKISLMVIAVLALILLTTACAGNAVSFKIRFDVDGTVIKTIDTDGKEIIKMPDDPTKEGYTFDGWYWDKDVWNLPFTANSLMDAPLSSNMTVYAKWKADIRSIRILSDKTEYPVGTFDFEDHRIEITYSDGTIGSVNIPEDGITASDLTKTNAVGEQILVVSYEGFTANLSVRFLPLSFEGVSFQNKTVTYTGQSFSIEPENLPEGTQVTYSISNSQAAVGRYEISATISKNNYKSETLSAVLTIEKALIFIYD